MAEVHLCFNICHSIVTPLMIAIDRRHENFVRLLLKHDDIDVNIQDNNGCNFDYI